MCWKFRGGIHTIYSFHGRSKKYYIYTSQQPNPTCMVEYWMTLRRGIGLLTVTALSLPQTAWRALSLPRLSSSEIKRTRCTRVFDLPERRPQRWLASTSPWTSRRRRALSLPRSSSSEIKRTRCTRVFDLLERRAAAMVNMIKIDRGRRPS